MMPQTVNSHILISVRNVDFLVWNSAGYCRYFMVLLCMTAGHPIGNEEGARDYLKIMSYVGTAHKQGHNAYEAIRNAITGCPEFIFE